MKKNEFDWQELYKCADDETREDILSYIERHPINFASNNVVKETTRHIINKIRSKTGKRNILVILGRYEYLADQLCAFGNVYALDADLRGVNYLKRNILKPTEIIRQQGKLYNAYRNDNNEMARNAINIIKQALASLQIELFIAVDYYPIISRVLFKLCKEMKIKTVLISHGALELAATEDKRYKTEKYMEKYVDYRWVWSENASKLLQEKQLYVNRIGVLGYPYDIKEESLLKKPKKILFVGSRLNFETEEEKNQYYEIVSKINEICKKMGVKLAYRKHPGEKTKLDADIICDRDNLQQQLSQYKGIIGVHTTVLLEAGVYGATVGQINWKPERQEKYLFPNSYIFNENLDGMESFIKGILSETVRPKELTQSGLRYKEPLNQRLAQVLDEIGFEPR